MHLPTICISQEGIAHSVLFIIVSLGVDSRWSIIMCCMNEWTNEWVSCIHFDTILGLRVLKPIVFTTLAECHLANSGCSIKDHQMTGRKPTWDIPNPPRYKTPGSGTDPRQHLADPVPGCVLITSPSGPLFLHDMEPIRYTHFPKMLGQPSGWIPKLWASPWEWAPEEQGGLGGFPGHKRLSFFPEKKMFHSVTSL